MLLPYRSRSLLPNTLLLLVLCPLSACSDGEGDSKPAQTATAAAEGIPICDLLTGTEVSRVLPDHDGGYVASSGGSLITGVDTYQCSYTARRDGDADLMTVIVTVASNTELFEDVKPTASVKRAIYANFREIETADGGFLYGEPDDMKVDAWTGTSVISLELMAPEAESHSDTLVALASTIAAKID